jgi:hypothetical protein
LGVGRSDKTKADQEKTWTGVDTKERKTRETGPNQVSTRYIYLCLSVPLSHSIFLPQDKTKENKTLQDKTDKKRQGKNRQENKTRLEIIRGDKTRTKNKEPRQQDNTITKAKTIQNNTTQHNTSQDKTSQDKTTQQRQEERRNRNGSFGLSKI